MDCRVWLSAGADICWEGVASHVNDHSTLPVAGTMRWGRVLHMKTTSRHKIFRTQRRKGDRGETNKLKNAGGSPQGLN